MTLGVMSLIFEAAVSILLIVVIVYAVKLNRRILALRAQEGELKEMIAQFNDAAVQAEASAGHLKSAGADSERNLRATIERAQAMRDDLSFIIERGGNMSDRVNRSIERSRERTPTKPPVEHAIKASEPAAPEFDGPEIERNAERAVEAMVDRFASEAEPSLWLAATRNSSDGGKDTMPAGDKSAGFDREHWFDDDPQPAKSSDEPPADPIAIAGSRVSAWTPGAGTAAVTTPAEDSENSSRSDAERKMLEAVRTSGARR